jgi:DNA-binding transcriptional LysR family regulator
LDFSTHLPTASSFRCSDSDALLQATISGLGVAHLATWLVSEEISAGRLIALFPPEASSAGTEASAIHAVRVAGRASAKTKLFIEHLKAEFGVDGGGAPHWEKSFESNHPTK